MPVLVPVAVAAPAVLIALLGLAHPVFLTPATADRWQLTHVALLPAFPLLAVSIWVLLRGRAGPLAWAARLAAAAYAVLYTALDSIAGIGAAEQVRASGPGPPPSIEALYDVGDRLGHVGVLALALAAALTATALRRGTSAAGAAVVVLGCGLFYRHHVFPPWGVLGMLVIAAGLALMAWQRPVVRQ